MAMVEKTLEDKIITAITAAMPATITPAQYDAVGFWQTNAVARINGILADPSKVALIEVATGLGNQVTFSDPNVTFAVTVSLVLRAEIAVNDNALATFAEPINELFKGWMASTYQQTFTALDINGKLSVDEVSVSGGTPAISTDNMVSSVTRNLTLAGSYPPPSTSNN